MIEAAIVLGACVMIFACVCHIDNSLRRCRRRLARIHYFLARARRLDQLGEHSNAHECAMLAWEELQAELGDDYHEYRGRPWMQRYVVRIRLVNGEERDFEPTANTLAKALEVAVTCCQEDTGIPIEGVSGVWPSGTSPVPAA